MDIYDGRYFRINKKLMTMAGLWPYETSLARKLLVRVYLGITVFGLMLPQLYGLCKNLEIDIKKSFEHIAIITYLFVVSLKLITVLKKVYDNVAENWLDIRDTRERGILAEYSENGITLTKGYIGYMLTSALFFIALVPATPLLLNIVAPIANETRRPDFIFKGEYPVDDMYDYYLVIFAFDTHGILVAISVLFTVDTMYACCVEHCVGLFAIIKDRLRLCSMDSDTLGRDIPYERIVDIVKLHAKTIAFADLLEKSYSRPFLFIVGLNMAYTVFVSVLVLIKLDDKGDMIRFIGPLGGSMIHLFYVSWPSQKLINHSTNLFDDAYTNEWYNISRKSKRLLWFMKLRCLKPCRLTAGGIYVMNFQNFAAVFKTSASYITVFAKFT